MAAAVVLPPSSGLSSPAESQYSSTLETRTMADAIAPQPRSFLTQKMITVLRETDYNESAIETLTNRAESNMLEASNISAQNFLGDSDSISYFLESNLLSESILRERNIYLNSNEPVLLLGFPAGLQLNIQKIRQLKENVLLVLRSRNIKPVRVYVRESKDDDSGFAFSLLNVVNSDIGVNMVSLLDAAFYGSAWKDELVLKEAYNGSDLIWRDEAWSNAKDESIVKDQQVSAERFEAPAVIEVHEEETNVLPTPSEPHRTAQYKSVDDVPDDDEEDEPELVQHPALKDLLEREAQRPAVQHPTWSRDHDRESYLDVIKAHSSRLGDSHSLSLISHPSDAKEDDFDVVDRP